MLSKSQARLFFLGTTLSFSCVFLYLTVDSLGKVPERSHQEKMTEAVVRGKGIWEQNNCMGCHTLLGEGAYYAPELTRVYERRGEQWLRIFLKDPQAMYPGKRKMVNYHFSDGQIEDVVQFLQWIGGIDTNGFPQKPDMAAAGLAMAPTTQANQATQAALAQAPAYFTSVCQACHAVAGKGGVVGPALDGVANRYTREKLDLWLTNPAAVKPGTAMPNLGLDTTTRDSLTAYLMTLQ